MRKLLGTLVLAMIALAVVGAYRGWFEFQSTTQDEKTKIEITIDQDRLKQDAEKFKEGVHEFSDRVNPDSSTDLQEPTGPSDPLVLPPDRNPGGLN